MVSPPKRNYQKKRRTRNNEEELDFMFVRTNYRFLFEGVKKRYKDFINRYDLKKDVDYRIVSGGQIFFKKDSIGRLIKQYIENLDKKVKDNNLEEVRIILQRSKIKENAKELKKEAEELKKKAEDTKKQAEDMEKKAEDMEKQAEKEYEKKKIQVYNEFDILQYESMYIYEQLEGTEYKSLQNEINILETWYVDSPNGEREVLRIPRNSFSRK